MKRTHPPSTRRKAIHGGSTPASMRVMVIDKCVRFTSLAVNGTAVMMCIKTTACLWLHVYMLQEGVAIMSMEGRPYSRYGAKSQEGGAKFSIVL